MYIYKTPYTLHLTFLAFNTNTSMHDFRPIHIILDVIRVRRGSSVQPVTGVVSNFYFFFKFSRALVYNFFLNFDYIAAHSDTDLLRHPVDNFANSQRAV